ncbi:MAG: M48 family metallopeptidase [Synechococcales cyanobacterium T60_A2020_003]|nr:M48 family metallopeptidase [Synechococcales cyanobacterium T60_A2020_003]
MGATTSAATTSQINIIQLGDIRIEVVRKNIKNIHLSVYPPHGAVRISAPIRMDLERIRVFAIAKLAWIKQQQTKLQSQLRETPREYIDRESHYLWGERYLLNVIEKDAVPQLKLKHKQMVLQVRPGADQNKKHSVLEASYRQQLKSVIPPLIAKWEKRLGVTVTGFTVRKMKTKWGSCSPAAKTLRLNLELAKKPQDCLEYVVLHEMIHLLEPTHNDRFIALMDRFMPSWRFYQEKLNQLPVRHESWLHQTNIG